MFPEHLQYLLNVMFICQIYVLNQQVNQLRGGAYVASNLRIP